MNGRFETKETPKMAKFKITWDAWLEEARVEFVEADGFYVTGSGAAIFYAESSSDVTLALRDWDRVERVEE